MSSFPQRIINQLSSVLPKYFVPPTERHPADRVIISREFLSLPLGGEVVRSWTDSCFFVCRQHQVHSCALHMFVHLSPRPPLQAGLPGPTPFSHPLLPLREHLSLSRFSSRQPWSLLPFLGTPTSSTNLFQPPEGQWVISFLFYPPETPIS